MWLLEANIDVHLVSVLAGFDISCDTAGQRGWKSLSNGELARAAVDAGFKCLLTRDRLFGESASQALKQFPEFEVVVVNVLAAALATISRGIPCSMEETSDRADCRRIDSVAVRASVPPSAGRLNAASRSQ